MHISNVWCYANDEQLAELILQVGAVKPLYTN